MVNGAFRRGLEDPVDARESHAHGIDENVAVVRRMKIHLAADRRHAHAIAVSANSGDDACHEMPRLLVFRRAEAERVHHRDRPRAHGEDVTHDAAHARCGTLIRLNEGRMIVAFHLEYGGVTVANINHARVFPGALQHPGRFRRQTS